MLEEISLKKGESSEEIS